MICPALVIIISWDQGKFVCKRGQFIIKYVNIVLNKIKGNGMAKNMKKPTPKVLVAILMLLVFSGFYFLLAPYINEGVGEDYTEVRNTADAAAKVETETAKQSVDKSSQYLILVNKKHGLKKRTEPKDLKQVKFAAKDREAQFQKLRKAAANAFSKLATAADKKGCTIRLTNGFRPYSYQQMLYEQYVKKDGKKKANKYSAKPGYSEHQTGLSADVSSPSVDYELVQKYGKTKEGKWLAKNAHKYGFIIRYPKGKEDITGYEYEPWHIRYVGKDAAKEIYEQGVTLEEYLGEL